MNESAKGKWATTNTLRRIGMALIYMYVCTICFREYEVLCLAHNPACVPMQYFIYVSMHVPEPYGTVDIRVQDLFIAHPYQTSNTVYGILR